jgi:hypothetical protein
LAKISIPDLSETFHPLRIRELATDFKNTAAFPYYFCLLGGFGYIMDYVILVGICLNLGMGGAMGTAVVGLLIYFNRLKRDKG